MTEIKFDKRNYRKHNQRNKDLIKKSLEECGAGRSIVIDNEGEIIAGNGIYEQAKALNIPVKIIESDGSELVVVKRTDLATDDEKRKQMAVMDNSTSDSSEFDLGLLKADFSLDTLENYGVDLLTEEDGTAYDEMESKYTRKVNIPTYEIKGENPSLAEMVDTEKADGIIKEIEDSSLSEDDKNFLKLAATRLYEFRYDKIAEHYAHSDKEKQELMEKLALVIIDLDDAIKNGYVQLNKFIEEVFLDENGIAK